MPQVNVNGHTVAYEERGSGTPLVLVHGFPLDRRIWKAQLDELSDRCRVIAVDLPGFGESKGERVFTMQSLAADLHAFLGQINALPCVLAGLSMGGYVAFEYLIKYATDLKGLVLIDTKCEGDTAEAKENRNKMIEAVRKSGSKAVADAMEPKMLAPDTVAKNPPLVKQVREIMEGCPPKTIENALMAMRDRADHCSQLPSIAVPTMIVVGEYDVITPPAGALGMNREIPHSRVCVISHAGHLAPMENAKSVNKALAEFVGEVGKCGV